MHMLPQTVPDVTKRNQFLMERLEVAAPMLRNLSYTFRSEYEDLQQIAAVALLEKYEQWQCAPNPLAYAQSVMRNAIIKQFRDHPSHIETFNLGTLSLDMGDDGRTSYAESLPAPSPAALDSPTSERVTEAIHAALRCLPLEEQVYLCRIYKINAYTPTLPTEGRAAGRRPDATRSDEAVSASAFKWLRRDQRLITATCPSYSAQDALLECKQQSGTSPVHIGDLQRQRLDAAYARLQQRGGKISVKALQQEAQIDNHIASAYMCELKSTAPAEPSKRQRLDAAYARLQQRGGKISVKALARESHTNDDVAGYYLKQREPERSLTPKARLEKAVMLLQSRGQALTGRALAEVARVKNDTAYAYLRQTQNTVCL